jgi:hypothetical protein
MGVLGRWRVHVRERMATWSQGAYLLNVFGIPFFCVI